MPIAIYRHLKLTVAVPHQIRPTVVGLHARRLRSVQMDRHGDGKIHTVSVVFHHLSRQGKLPGKLREVWQFTDSTFTISQERYRAAGLVKTFASEIPPASTVAWTENGKLMPIYMQFEKEMSSRAAAELYLHHHTPNPNGFMLLQFDFSEQNALGQPKMSSWALPPLEVAQRNATIDHSENSERWAQLFLE